MSTNFDNFKKKVKTAASATVDATKQFAIISKCKLLIAAEQEKIRSLYTKLGKVYYKDYVTDEEPDEAEYKPLCSQISARYRKIAQLRDRIEEVKANYQDVKQECREAKQKATEAEDRLITIASSRVEEDYPEVEAEEADLLEELNSLNNDTPYGEILD